MVQALDVLIVKLQPDFIIVGTGIAALWAAINLDHAGKTIVLTKSVATAGSTGYAQGALQRPWVLTILLSNVPKRR